MEYIMGKLVEDLSAEVPAEEQDEAAAQDSFDEGLTQGSDTKPGPARDDSGRFVAKEEEKSEEEQPAAAPPAAKPAEKAAATPAKPAAAAKPEYVQITKDQLAKLEAAVGRSEEHEKQFSKVFGTVGDMQKIMRNLQAQTPRGAAVKLPPGAFDAMKKDFPELASHMQTAMESILKGAEGTGAPGAHLNPEEFEQKLQEKVLAIAAEDLADEFPDWQKIVGAVNTTKGEKPDPNNLFRKWLSTKPQEYQDRINLSNSAGVITRAIRTFKSETKAATAQPAKPNAQAAARANRISEALRPKGDGGQPPGQVAEDDFEAGFKHG